MGEKVTEDNQCWPDLQKHLDTHSQMFRLVHLHTHVIYMCTFVSAHMHTQRKTIKIEKKDSAWSVTYICLKNFKFRI